MPKDAYIYDKNPAKDADRHGKMLMYMKSDIPQNIT